MKVPHAQQLQCIKDYPRLLDVDLADSDTGVDAASSQSGRAACVRHGGGEAARIDYVVIIFCKAFRGTPCRRKEAPDGGEG